MDQGIKLNNLIDKDLNISRRKFVRLSAITAGAVASTGFTGCLGGDGLEELGVGYQPHYFQAASGILAASEVDQVADKEINYSGFLSGSAMISSMVSQKRFVGYMGDMPGLVAANEDRIDGGGHIVAKNNSSPGATLSIVTREGEFDSVSDLDREDIQFRVNNYSYAHRWVLQVLLEENFQNLRAEDLLDGVPATFNSQLRQGSIDAYANWEPFPSMALYISKNRGGTDLEVLTTGQDYPEFTGISVVVFHPLLVDKYRNIGVAWLKKHMAMQKILKNQRKQAVSLMSNQPSNPGVSYPKWVADRALKQMEKGNFTSHFTQKEKSELEEGIAFLQNPPGDLSPVISEDMTLEESLDTSLLKEAQQS